ncbi:melanophilin isoform X2 [Ambystoma mexicanum]|uniref:melanophilin isoform X2 n=1 Tax=Ambystoma mexicanum TaxID=8296 RepID=UPI0037E79487
MGRKLDLSKLTDEEARHVWDVIQRDFDLRKKEEERLDDLKGKVEKESTKRELISNQSHLNETHCLHCLQPFKFLVNSKRQCLDCRFYACKNCSRYNKKEQGWVCDACRVTRVVKIGSLEWYYEHVRSRFKRFGSAKVMRSLYGRLQPGQGMDPALLGLHDRFSSLPNINREYQRQVDAGMFPDDEEEDGDVVDSAEAQRYNLMRKTKRLLSVHPFDFELDSEYSAQSRRQSVQLSPAPIDHDVQSFSEFTGPGRDTLQKESMIAEADLAAMFHHILQEQGHNLDPPEQEFSTEVRLTVNSRRKSIENNRRSENCASLEPPQQARATPLPRGGPLSAQQRSQYAADMDTSEEEASGAPKFPIYHPHHFKRRSRSSSQEGVPHSTVQSPGPEPQTDADIEEVTLKRKLGELASNISDKGASSEEEEKKVPPRPVLSSSSDDLPSDAQKVYFTAGKTYGLEKRLRSLEEQAQQSGTTDSELSELEVGVASAAVLVQHTESEVSDIESRIAALSAAGMTVTPAGKSKRRSTPQTSKCSSPISPSLPQFPVSGQQEPLEVPKLSSPDEAKVTAMQQALRRKFHMSLEMADGPDGFGRNSLYRGSLTQRNPNGKNKKLDRVFAKPVLTNR